MGHIIRLNLLKGLGTGGLRESKTLSAERVGLKPRPEFSPISVIQGSIYPIMVVDAGGAIRDANDAALLLLDQEMETLRSTLISDVVLRLDTVVMDLIIKAAPMGRPVVMDAICARPNGAWVPCEVIVNQIIRQTGVPTLVYLVLSEVDKTREHEDAMGGLEAKLAKAERLEMAGLVAGQIAHDFNNLLTPLLAYPELIRQEVKDNPTVGEYLDIIEKTAGDMSRLTHQLLALARRGRVGTEQFCINEVIGQVVSQMKPGIPTGIEVRFSAAENLLEVAGGRDQVRRAVEHLLQNSVDAMGSCGALDIRTENVYLDAPVGKYAAVNIGEYVRITITDTGSGIPEEIRDRIFDPFFTTKRAAKQRGSGLGLSIVHGIVRDHHGYLDFDSEVGKGTVFHLYIPIARSPVAQSGTESLPHGKESVLIVDDDQPQVDVLKNLLEVLGYAATGVTSGEECLALLRKQGRRFDLIILDMVMERGIDGLVTYAEIKKLIPDQRVILISGFSRAARRIAEAQQLGAGTYLRKPLTIDRVARAVRDELDRPIVPASGGAARPRSRRILIVDDEAMIRKLFSMIVMSEFPDAVIDQAGNGREALEAFAAGRYEVVIMDLQMPLQDGRETFAALEQMCINKNWPLPVVVFCTGFSPPESLLNVIGGNERRHLLRKPVKADVLVETLRKCLAE